MYVMVRIKMVWIQVLMILPHVVYLHYLKSEITMQKLQGLPSFIVIGIQGPISLASVAHYSLCSDFFDRYYLITSVQSIKMF